MEGSRGLNRNIIKYIAIFAMLADHIAMLFITAPVPYVICRVVGRLTCPVMCYFLAEGFTHTSSRAKYAIRLAVFAVISQFAYTFAHYGTVLTYSFFYDWNFIMTLLISFALLICCDVIKNVFALTAAAIGLMGISYFCDWGIFAPAFVLAFYMFRDSKNRQTVAYAAICLLTVIANILFVYFSGIPWYTELWQLGLYLFIPFIYLYSGERGGKSAFHKWFFYLFYPVHLAVLATIKLLLIP